MKTILVGLDLSEPYTRLIDRAESVARVYAARLRLVYVAPPDPSFLGSASWPQVVRDGFASELKEEHTELMGVAESIREKGISADSLMVRGHVVESLLEQLQKTQPEMIVLGSMQEGGLFEALGGGVVRGMLKRGGCPVLVVPLPAKEGEDGESLCASGEEQESPGE